MDVQKFIGLSDQEKRTTLLKMREKASDEILQKIRVKGSDNETTQVFPEIAADKANKFKPFSLTDVQQSFLVGKHFSESGDHVGCHIYLEFDVDGLDVKRLQDCWQILVENHEMLRAIVMPDGTQRIVEDIPEKQDAFLDLSDAGDEVRQKCISKIRDELSHKVYKPGDWPLYEIRISKLPESRFCVHFSIDEWVVDGASMHLLLRQWYQLYHNNDFIPPKTEISFRDYVLALDKFRESSKYKQDLAYWENKLKRLPDGYKFSAEDLQSEKQIERRRAQKIIEAGIWDKIKDLVKRLNVSPSTFLLTLFCEVLRNSSGQQDMSLIMTFFNRLSVSDDIEKIVGPFISTNIFISTASDTLSLEKLLQQNQRQLWEDLDHAGVSGVQVLRMLKNKKQIDPAIALPVVFTSMLGNFNEHDDDASWLDEIGYSLTQTPQVYLDYQVFERNGCLYIAWDHAVDMFSVEQINTMLEVYCAVLHSLSVGSEAWSNPLVIKSIVSGDSYIQSPVDSMLVKSDISKRYDVFSLTEIQQAYFVGRSALMDKDSVSCQFYQEINAKEIDVHDIEREWNHLIQSHDALRTVINESGDQCVVRECPHYNIRINNLTRLKPDHIEVELGDIRARLSKAVFPLGRWPFFDISVSLLPENRLRIHFAADLLIADGNSMQLLISQLIESLAGQGRISAPDITYRDYQQTIARMAESTAGEQAQAYWEQKFQTLLPGPQLPAAEVQEGMGFIRKRYEAELSNWENLKTIAAQYRVPPSYVLLTAYADTLLAYNDQRPFTLVVVNWDRFDLHPHVNELIGDFTSLSWLTVQPDKESFITRVKKNYRQIQEDLRHSVKSGLQVLKRRLLSERNGKINGFPVVFTQLPLQPAVDLPENFELGYGISQTPQVNLDCIGIEVGGHLRFHWDTVQGVYSQQVVQSMFSLYSRLLEKLASHPVYWRNHEYYKNLIPADKKTVCISADEPRSFPPQDWNHTAVDYPDDICLHEWIERIVTQYADKTAVISDENQVSYAELNRKANQWAHHLRKIGAGPDQPVAVFMERSTDMVIALLAIIKSGAAYLPVDVGNPEDRVAYILEDAGVGIILSRSTQKQKLVSVSAKIFCIDSDDDLVEGLTGENPVVSGSPENLAYVIYTSGSTGKPKGCMLSHAAICNRLLWMRDQYRIGADDRILQKTPYTFDVSVWEFFLPLMTGATLVLAKPHGHQDAHYLIELIRKESVTVCHFVPSMLNVFLKDPAAASCTSLQKVFTSGEALPYKLMEKFLDALPAELHNLYGPTEAAVDVTYWHCQKNADQIVPIGKPVANTQLYILDENLKPLPVGIEGELYIGGVQLARGYLNRPELTQERFIDWDIPGGQKIRLYKTGDRVRYLPDGNIEFLGRADFQVKLRGLRIELEEIETALLEIEYVTEAVVLVQEQDSDDPKLVAYLSGKKGGDFSLKSVRERLRKTLPEYMLPNGVVFMNNMPTTEHGKLDRKALPWPVTEVTEAKSMPAENPDNDLMVEIITAYLESALGITKINPDEDLFDIGVTSLTLVQISQKIYEQQGVKVPVEVFLDEPTIAAIAHYVVCQRNKSGQDINKSKQVDEYAVPEKPAGESENISDINNIQTGIIKYLQEALSVEDIDLEQDLFDIGVTSLTLVQIAQKIQDQYKVKVPVEVFLDDPNVGAIASYVAAHIDNTGYAGEESTQKKDLSVIPKSPELVSLPESQIPQAAFHRFSTQSQFSNRALSLSQFSQWIGLLKQHVVNGQTKYLYPSGGGKNAVQVYLYIKPQSIEGIAGGIYYYHPVDHALVAIDENAHIDNTFFHNAYHDIFRKAGFCVFFIAQYSAIEPFYADASTTLVELDAGYMSQLLLKNQNLGSIGAMPVTGADFARIRHHFKLDKTHCFLDCLLAGYVDGNDHVADENGQNGIHSALSLTEHHIKPETYRSLEDIVTSNKTGSYSTLSKEELAEITAEQRYLRKSNHCRVISLDNIQYPDNDYLLRSCQREYSEHAVSLQALAKLLGTLQPLNANKSLSRLYPSSAGIYSVEAYVYVKADGIQGLAEGIYKYIPEKHALLVVNTEIDDLDKHIKSCHVPFNRTHYIKSKFNIFLVADLSTINQDYGNYGVRLAHFEAGRIGQLFMDHQSELDLGVCPIGGMRFDKIESYFKLHSQQLMLHSFVCGHWQHSGAVSRPLWDNYTGDQSSDDVLNSGLPEKSSISPEKDIAIIGVSGRYPGAANPEAFWEILKQGESAISEVPESRWRVETYYNPEGENEKSYSKWGGFLPHVDTFDSLLFNISPMEARLIDPQERLFLEVVWECLENAGYTGDSLQATAPRVGVFVGAMWSDYQSIAMDGWDAEHMKKTFSFHSSIANRVSHYFNLQGPSIAIDTSCSSALTALHLAVESMRRGECDAAIVGGVNIIAHPYHQNNLCGLNLLSRTEKSSAFGAAGTGWVPGEGVGALLIRSLDTAQKAEDYIHGIVKTTAITHSGRTPRYGMPSSENQAQSIAQTLKKASLSSADISYVESAAAGAALADASEIDALKKVFCAKTDNLQTCAIGSVKPNVGHLESASFMSQLTKVLLQMRHNQLAPSIDCDPVNPLLELDDSGLYINRELSAWSTVDPQQKQQNFPVRALINGFGATGSNGHAIVESYKNNFSEIETGPQLIVLSAASEAQLRAYAKSLRQHLAEITDIELGAVAHTLQMGRVPMQYRLAIIADNLQELIDRLGRFCTGENMFLGLYTGSTRNTDVNQDIDYHKLDDIASKWVAGSDINWQEVCKTNQKIPLPTYPFLKERHWFDREPEKISTNTKEETADMPLHQEIKISSSSYYEDAALLENVENYFQQMYAKLSGIAVYKINVDTPLIDYGINSLLINSINSEIDNHFTNVSKTVLFECQTLKELARYFVDKHRDETIKVVSDGLSAFPLSAMKTTGNIKPVDDNRESRKRAVSRSQKNDEPIAIIGLSGRYPMANNMSQLWENLKEGRDCISEVPASRWDPERYGLKNCWGGFIDNADKFDPLFFNISPTEAQIMDPQERQFLQVAWEALEDAGYTRLGLQRSCEGNVGVFVGVMYGEYQLYGAEQALQGKPVALGSAYGSIANRVSYFLNINGPSMAIDTLCSSSLTCAHTAVESIRQGECRMAIVGGVNLSLHPNKYLLHAQMNMTSSDGRCHSFGEGGDGFVPGEGVGAVILKPLSEAEKDGDNIYGLIAATAVNHDGKTNGYTVPNPQRQGLLIKKALESADIDPRHISYIEAHGTGTALGDPIEISGLSSAFGEHTEDKQFCAIGSVKSNIGHLESAAGMASISKVLLQMKHQTLVPSIHSETLNSNIDFSDTQFTVQRALEKWEQPELSVNGEVATVERSAGISSFGAGGANAHIILKEYQSPVRESLPQQNDYLFLLSAKNDERLAELIRRWQVFLKKQIASETVPDLTDMAYTLQAGREAMNERVAIVFKDANQLLEILSVLADGSGIPESVFKGNAKADSDRYDWLLSGNEAVDIIDVFIRHRNLAKLSRFWVSGADIDWELLYVEQPRPRRISLPLYPFAQNRYWISDITPAVTEKKVEAAEVGLHPLLDKNESTLAHIQYTKKIDSEFCYRQHHLKTADNRLSGPLMLQMAKLAAELAAGDQKVTYMSNLSWSEPVISVEEPLALNTRLYPDNDHRRLEFETLAVSDKEEVVAQGTIHLKTLPEAKQAIEIINIDALKEQCQTVVDVESLMQGLRAEAIFDGKPVNAINTIQCSKNRILVDINMPAAATKDELALPLVIDLGFSTLSYLLGTRYQDNSMLMVPFEIGHLVLSGEPSAVKYLYLQPARNTFDKDPEDKAYDLTAISSAGEVIFNVEGCLCKPIAQQPDAVTEVALDAAQLLYKSVDWSPVPLEVDPVVSPGSGDTLLFDTGTDLSEQLHQSVSSGTCYRVFPGDAYIWHDANTVSINPSDATHFVRLFEDLDNKDLNLQRIVHCWSKGEFSDKQALDAGLYSVFHCVQALMANKPEQDIPFLYVHTSNSDSTDPYFQAMSGFLKTVAYELPRLKIKNIEVAVEGDDTPARAAYIAELIMRELQTVAQGSEDIRYKAGEREIPEFVDAVFTDLPGQTTLRQNGVYLITGGFGGLGRLFAGYLAKHYQAKLVLSGRSPAGSDIHAFLDELRRDGGEAIYLQSDIAERSQADALVNAAIENFGSINGVLHTAGVLQDAYISNKNLQQIEKVIAPKVKGTLNLDAALANTELDLFILFSSIVGVMGNVGQCDYAYANSFLDHFAGYRNAQVQRQERYGLTRAINWPLWRDGAMTTDEATKAWITKEFGLVPLKNKYGLRAFDAVLSSRSASTIVLAGYQEQVDTRLGVSKARTAGYYRLQSRHTSLSVNHRELMQANKPETKEVKPDDIQEITEAPKSASVAATQSVDINDFLRAQLSEVTGIAEAEIDAVTEFWEMGLDSILAMKIIEQIESHYGLRLYPNEMLEYNNLSKLTAYLSSELQAVTTEKAPVQESATEQVQQNSTSEINAFLCEKLSEVTGIAEADIDSSTEFWEMGLDSILAMKIIEQIEEQYGLRLYPNEMLEYNNLTKLTAYLEGEIGSGTDVKQPALQESADTEVNNTPVQNIQPESPDRSAPVYINNQQTRKPLVYVLSTPRAGSTLLRVMMAGHSSIFSPPELHLLPYDTLTQWNEELLKANQKYLREGLIKALTELEKISTENGVAQLETLQADGISVAETYTLLQRLAGERYVVDKSPTYALESDILQRAEQLSESPLYIHLIRHPLSVAESFVRNRFDKLFSIEGDAWEYAGRLWHKMNSNIAGFLQGIPPHRQLQLHYEQLVSDPAENMQALCRFLNVPFEESMLNPYEGDRMTDGLHQHSIPIGDPNFSKHNKIEAAYANAWEAHKDMLGKFDQKTIELAEQLGYVFDRSDINKELHRQKDVLEVTG